MLWNEKARLYLTIIVLLIATLLWCAESSADQATFNCTGAQQTWVVPFGVNSVTIDATGARGGNSGGLGAKATGTYSVTPGEALYIYVGGQGGSSGGIPWGR